MRKLVLALVAVMMAGCNPYYENPSKDESVRYKIIYLDSCEYIKHKYTPEITHKGNCKYCVERRRQELKELLDKKEE